ncbi:AfsR/SARP family transcriptional regulator [Kitasatospora sp. NBC_01266]|uniref:AfsR/SARP family transcriptional regulator n=1 Tax=Kitasatospora sp. NBC_01266 TaxID=2903572 RepID=UPI002E374A27|nr:BTAD domain-containing putative transcriptional regulator [Kitasatospora sp. NBC_01266]
MIQPVRFFLLGAVRARYGDEELPVGSPLQQAMLAVLLLRDGRSVGAGELIEALWGEAAPTSASAMLRTYAWRWRKVLDREEREPGTPAILASVGDGYRTVLAPEAIDALRVEQLAAAARGAIRGGEGPEQGRRLLTEALDLWSGEPLSRVPGPFAEQQRARLGDLRVGLLEQRCELDLELGDPAPAVSVLRELTAGHSLRERPYALLMRALYQSGYQADALAVYGRIRRLLAEELGVDPGPELRDIHQRILSSDPALLGARGGPVTVGGRGTGELERRTAPAGPPPGEPAASATAQATAQASAQASAPAASEPVESAESAEPAAVPAQLPAGIADFTGRQAELDALHAVLGEAVLARDEDAVLPIAAISGMGGVGKTTVALRVAHRLRPGFPDGQLYADLRGDQAEPVDPNVVLASFLTALGVPAAGVPQSLEDRARLFRSLLDVRRVLILLDNARDAAQVRPLLPGSARCAVLVTGRARLFGLATAAQIDLDVFSVAEATEVLTRAAGAERIAADPGAVRELIRYCGRLPLAVRIVAARLASRPAWTVAHLAARLTAEQDRMAELRLGDLAVAAAFDWGYRQLTAEQARAFRVIAEVSRPDIGVPTAAAVLGVDQRRAEGLLESLVDAGMVTAPRSGRYRYHDLLRVFALQLAEPVGLEEGTALHRQLDFLLATATGAFQHLVPGDPIGTALCATVLPGLRFEELREATAWVAEEFDAALTAVLAAAGEHSSDEDVRMAADLLIALSPFDADPRHERRAAAAAAVSAAARARGDQRSLGRAEFIRGNLAVQAARLVEAGEHSRRAADACRAVGDVVVLQQALNDLGLLAQHSRRFDEAVQLYEEANMLARALGQQAGQTATTLNAALARVRAGLPAEAAAACRELLPALTAAKDWGGRSYALYILGLAAHESGDYQEAAAAYQECLELCLTARIPLRQAQARYRLADTLRLLGRCGPAVTQARLALAGCEELLAERDQGHALVALARGLAELGQFTEAQERLRQAAALFARLGLPDGEDVRQLLAELDSRSAAA